MCHYCHDLLGGVVQGSQAYCMNSNKIGTDFAVLPTCEEKQTVCQTAWLLKTEMHKM